MAFGGVRDRFTVTLSRWARCKPTGFPLPDGGRGIFSPIYIDNFVTG